MSFSIFARTLTLIKSLLPYCQSGAARLRVNSEKVVLGGTVNSATFKAFDTGAIELVHSQQMRMRVPYLRLELDNWTL
jgi:hypothetical protein